MSNGPRRFAAASRAFTLAAMLPGMLTAGASAGTTGKHARTVAAARFAEPSSGRLPPGADAWLRAGRKGIRGLTLGPIESALHPDRGYGSAACALSMAEARRLGANWVSLTPFGRVLDGSPSGVDPTFEAPFERNKKAVARAVEQAHAEGLRVLVVPHLWVESGEWRGEIDPLGDDAWKRWIDGYGRFLLSWAKVAEASGVDMLAVGVELRSLATTTHAPLFSTLIREVRKVYHGLLVYSGNWDDIEDTVILGDVDVIGLNAFFPLSRLDDQPFDVHVQGAVEIAARMRALAESWHKPVVFTEIGYTTRTNTAVKPWLWPDGMSDVHIDQVAQAEAYAALLAPMLDATWFAGFFVWRLYADPNDVSQEAEWGFSPRGKLAELIVRDAFATSWGVDGRSADGTGWSSFTTPRAEGVSKY